MAEVLMTECEQYGGTLSIRALLKRNLRWQQWYSQQEKWFVTLPVLYALRTQWDKVQGGQLLCRMRNKAQLIHVNCWKGNSVYGTYTVVILNALKSVPQSNADKCPAKTQK